MQLEAGTLPAAYVCVGRQQNHGLSPPVHRTISEHEICPSAVAQHQVLVLQRMSTVTSGAWHADLPSTSPRDGPGLKRHIQKPQG